MAEWFVQGFLNRLLDDDDPASIKLLEKAVNEMSQLPGIGKRTALRLVLHLLRQPKAETT